MIDFAGNEEYICDSKAPCFGLVLPNGDRRKVDPPLSVPKKYRLRGIVLLCIMYKTGHRNVQPPLLEFCGGRSAVGPRNGRVHVFGIGAVRKCTIALPLR